MSLSRSEVLFGLGLLLTVLAVAAESAEPLLLFGLVLVMALLVTLATIPYLVFGPRLWWLTRGSLLALAAVVVSMPLTYGIWWRQTDLTRRRRAQVIAALETYHRRHGAYPGTLELLVPTYLPHYPATAYGLLEPRPFAYQPAPPGYLLSYYAGAMSTAHYASRQGQWTYDD